MGHLRKAVETRDNGIIQYIYMFISYSHGILLYYDKHYYEYTQ